MFETISADFILYSINFCMGMARCHYNIGINGHVSIAALLNRILLDAFRVLYSWMLFTVVSTFLGTPSPNEILKWGALLNGTRQWADMIIADMRWESYKTHPWSTPNIQQYIEENLNPFGGIIFLPLAMHWSIKYW